MIRKRLFSVIGVDPYEVRKSSLTADLGCLPAITYMDIINYLVCTKSSYTFEELKAVKSLESYNQFVNGWVNDVRSMTVNNKVLVTGRVRHSQRMNDTALKPWLISSPDGIVDSAHCDCMAGLGEVCTHVGALLFFIEQPHRISSQKTVTQEKAYWLLPSSIDKVPYAEIQNIDFTSTDTKKKRQDCAVTGESVSKRSSLKLPEVPEPTADEVRTLNRALFATGTKPSILSVTEEFQEEYIPDILKDGQLPVCLINLREDKYVEMERSELEGVCEQTFSEMKVTEKQARNAECITKEQSKSKEWHSLRFGRITASNMKSACSTSIDAPAMSTVKSICGNSKFTNKATQWGCKHESTALAAYSTKMKETHENACVEKCGMYINPEYPHIGASPDAVVKCDCCGEGVVEIKCPYCVKDQVLSEVGKRVEFLDSGNLKKNHRYLYQIQTQLLVTEKDFCDFVVWTEKDCSIERIEPCTDLQEKIKTKSRDFFLKVILPEVMGKLYTREQHANTIASDRTLASAAKNHEKTPLSETSKDNADSSSSQENKDDIELICVCQKPYDDQDDDVIGCDNENCPYVWLHFRCVNLKRVPKGLYFCPACKRRQPKCSKH